MTVFTADDTFKKLKGYTFEEVDEILQEAYLKYICETIPKPSVMDWIVYRDKLLLKTNWTSTRYISEKIKLY